jgi:serine/threonine protein kinase
MAALQGGDLRAALDGPQGAQFLWRNLGAGIAADIACGLAYIHTTGVVHRCTQLESMTL